MASGAKTGVAGDVIRLPKGGGALGGLGEKFSPDLYTGTGSLVVPISLPAGRGELQPSLSLAYSTGNGDGPFGLGWALTIPGVARKTSHGLPRYDDARDTFILSGAEDLVAIGEPGPGRVAYRPRTEVLFARIVHCRDATGDIWEVGTKDGLVNRYGSLRPASAPADWRDPAAIVDPDDPRRVFSWSLTETEDPFGNRIRYHYRREADRTDGPHRWDQIYLDRIQYADYGALDDPSFLVEVAFEYEPRPEPFSSYRSGFEIRTTLRCTTIRVTSHADAVTPVRTYRLVYQDQIDPSTSPPNGASLLSEIRVEGQDGDRIERLPTARFTYTTFDPDRRELVRLVGPDLPAGSLARPELELVDLLGNGLPDLIQMDGVVRYWRNLGGGRFDRSRILDEAPAGLSLAQDGVQLIDADGDGRVDLLVTTGPIAGYYPSRFGGTWDRRSFRAYPAAPTFSLEDPEVKLVDLDGDGVTDAVRSGDRFECYFNDRERGWVETTQVTRGPLDEFPDVSFSDPRVKWADMTGDGLVDIVLVHNGAIDYWPALGYGRWGKRVRMRGGPRLPDRFDPRRVLFGDIDGDGVADLVFVSDNHVTIWINRGGNGWSEPIEIRGTPRLTDDGAVRIVDLLGDGVAGLLWTSDPRGSAAADMWFLDVVRGRKPYLLSSMDNNRGSIMRMEYTPSTRFYLEDEKRLSTRWATPLPFPVQVVSKVETIDAISGSKLTSEYSYHHGYWDGEERELRGFARVDHRDTEVFERYHDAASGTFAAVEAIHFSPPVETRMWFDHGPIDDAETGWRELDVSHEHWTGDPQRLPRPPGLEAFLAGLPRRDRRDALRAMRGLLVRSELYALDGSARQDRPYNVTELLYGVREEWAPPDDASGGQRVFFPHPLAERTTRWERGDDPHHTFKVLGDYDEHGQPTSQISVAVPQGRDFTVAAPPGDPYLATQVVATYAIPTESRYVVDRVARVNTYEIPNDGSMPLSELVDAVSRGTWPRSLIGQVIHHYDGDAFVGLPFAQVGARGARVRTETLVFTDEILARGYRSGDDIADPPELPPYLTEGATSWPAEYPAGFRTSLVEHAGYVRHGDEDGSPYARGWFSVPERRKYDFHERSDGRGTILVKRDPLGRDLAIAYDEFDLLPVQAVSPGGLTIQAAYDYRAMQPREIIDPNGNVTQYRYSPVGLVEAVSVMGKPGEPAGDTPPTPSVRFEYDLLAWERDRQPIWTKTIRRVHHATETDVPPSERDETFETIEYSDGFGRLLQTRTQAADAIFGDPIEGDAGLPLDVDAPPGDAVGHARDPAAPPNVVVTSLNVFDNKGRVVESYQPFFATGWSYTPPAAAELTRRTVTFYDAVGRATRVVHPDGSEERTVYGIPVSPDDPTAFTPTPWETWAYDANDNAGRTHPAEAASYAAHWNTPVSTRADALGRAVERIARTGNGPEDRIVTRADYDLRGNVVRMTDALGRIAFEYDYDLANRRLRSRDLDGGVKRALFDAAGALIEERDAKGSLVVQRVDQDGRVDRTWARDRAGDRVTLRVRTIFGDAADSGLPAGDARDANLLGRLYAQYDEAGLSTTPRYDFKGRPLLRRRQVIADSELADVPIDDPSTEGVLRFVVDWEPPAGTSLPEHAASLLDPTVHESAARHDALDRTREVALPTDVSGERRRLAFQYDRGGGLRRVDVDGAAYVREIAHDAQGRRTLVVYGNGVMTRLAWDRASGRLARVRSERFTRPDGTAYRGTGAPLEDVGYRYDLVGNALELRDRAPGCGLPADPDRLDRAFRYDALYRLSRASGRECDAPIPGAPWEDRLLCWDVTRTRAYVEEYEYDVAGNLRELRHLSGGTGGYTRTLSPHDDSNRLRSLTIGATTRDYTHDACGNVIRETASRRFGWDHANLLRAFEHRAGDGPASVHAQYLYDAGGDRTKRFVRRGGTVETTVSLDGVFERRSLRTVDGVVTHDVVHVFDGATRVASLRIGPAFPGDDSPRVRYYLADPVGGASLVLDGTGNWTNREEHTPYGETSFGGFASKRFRFAGKERDDETGLHDFGARHYAAWLGRWMSPDPAGTVDGLNLYCYARNNPVVRGDPTGRQSAPKVDPRDVAVAATAARTATALARAAVAWGAASLVPEGATVAVGGATGAGVSGALAGGYTIAILAASVLVIDHYLKFANNLLKTGNFLGEPRPGIPDYNRLRGSRGAPSPVAPPATGDAPDPVAPPAPNPEPAPDPERDKKRRSPILADNSLLVHALSMRDPAKGTAALVEITQHETMVTSLVFKEFLNVKPEEIPRRLAFLTLTGVRRLDSSVEGAAQVSPEYARVKVALEKQQQEPADADLAGIAKVTGIEAVTLDKVLYNTLTKTLPQLKVPIRMPAGI
jgi:RHS repeat-associated protein